MFLESAFLGIVEGLTEFIPVSSTGHLILAADLMGIEDSSGYVFDVVIQLGAILAVCVIYFKRLWTVVCGLFARDKRAGRFAMAVLIAFLPAAILGGLLHDFIKQVLFSPQVVAISLVLGGVAMLAAERFFRAAPSTHNIEDFKPSLALKIGLAQCLALIPGVSRSGATIIGSLLMGVERKTAAEFSFFLAIPTMLGATTFDLYKNFHSLTRGNLLDIAVGFVSAFIVAMLVIRWFVGFISVRSFVPFAWYRIIFGAFVLAYLYFHGLTIE